MKYSVFGNYQHTAKQIMVHITKGRAVGSQRGHGREWYSTLLENVDSNSRRRTESVLGFSCGR